MSLPAFLTGNPRLAVFGNIWTDMQRLDLVNLWRDIGQVFILTARSTGVTGAISTGATITHTLGVIPSFVLLTPQDGGLFNYSVQNLTATTFQIVFTGGGTHIFGFSAEQ